jgi:hypothetical protein
MATSTFNPDTFLAQEIKGANETKFTPIPKGEWKAYIDELGMDEYENQPILIVGMIIPDEQLKKQLGMEQPKIADRIFLDYENGALAFGMNKNVKLGRLREATGLNDPKKPFNFNMLRGQTVMIMVDHTEGKPGTANAGETFARVTRYAKAPK